LTIHLFDPILAEKQNKKINKGKEAHESWKQTKLSIKQKENLQLQKIEEEKQKAETEKINSEREKQEKVKEAYDNWLEQKKQRVLKEKARKEAEQQQEIEKLESKKKVCLFCIQICSKNSLPVYSEKVPIGTY
jgi:hypothetical protein